MVIVMVKVRVGNKGINKCLCVWKGSCYKGLIGAMDDLLKDSLMRCTQHLLGCEIGKYISHSVRGIKG